VKDSRVMTIFLALLAIAGTLGGTLGGERRLIHCNTPLNDHILDLLTNVDLPGDPIRPRTENHASVIFQVAHAMRRAV